MNWCLIRHHDTSKDVLRIDHESPRGHIADTDVTPTRDHFGELFILLLKLTRCESELLPCSSASLPAGKPWAQSVGGSQCKLMLLASVGLSGCSMLPSGQPPSPRRDLAPLSDGRVIPSVGPQTSRRPSLSHFQLMA